MPLFALDPLWNDIYTAGGFWVGVVGLILGFIGYKIAIAQLRQTKQAADAAREAAERTLAENKEAFERFVAAYAGRLLSELRGAVNRLEWGLAELRAHDLADLLATLPTTPGIQHDAGLTEGVRTLRAFAQRFAQKATQTPPTNFRVDVLRREWEPLLLLFHQRLDRLKAPFRDTSHDQIGTNRSPSPLPADGPEPSGQDASRAGNVGEEPGSSRPPA